VRRAPSRLRVSAAVAIAIAVAPVAAARASGPTVWYVLSYPENAPTYRFITDTLGGNGHPRRTTVRRPVSALPPRDGARPFNWADAGVGAATPRAWRSRWPAARSGCGSAAAYSPGVFDHVTIRVSDREASERFYDAVLPVLGIEKAHSDGHYAEWGDFSLGAASPESPVTRGLHVAFVAQTREHVEEFWRAGLCAGYRDDGAPGPRPQYSEGYYGAFLLDPDGNSAEAVHHGSPRTGTIDHLWIRVRDVAASARFYELVAPHARYEPGRRAHDPERVHFRGADGSFSVVAGEPTEHVHVAFPAPDRAAVDAFHTALVAGGYRDNGPPGERPIYHPGYYGAYVLDPDGNNVELVHHGTIPPNPS
jgi:catechol 2,3-dioxygenase-like lactoylglutathione lyase family enzyme